MADLYSTIKIVPKDEKNLEACSRCRLIMSGQQWDDIDACPNCKSSNPVLHDDFVGMVSLIMPQHSWVSRFALGDMKNRIPGIYALHVPKDPNEDDDAEMNDGDEKFVVDDDNYE